MGNTFSEILMLLNNIQEKSTKNNHLDYLLTQSSCHSTLPNRETIDISCNVSSITLDINKLEREVYNIKSAMESEKKQLIEKTQKIEEIRSKNPDANVSTTIRKIGEIKMNIDRKKKLIDDHEKRIFHLVSDRDRIMSILESRDPALLLNKKRENSDHFEILFRNYCRLIVIDSISLELNFTTFFECYVSFEICSPALLFSQNIGNILQLPNTIGELLLLRKNQEVIQHFGSLSCTPMSCTAAKNYSGELNASFECPSTGKIANLCLFLNNSDDTVNDQHIRLLFPNFVESSTAILFLILYGILKNTFLGKQTEEDKNVMRDLKHYSIRRLMTIQTTIDTFCIVTVLAKFVVTHVNQENLSSLHDEEMEHLRDEYREHFDLIMLLVDILDIKLGPR